MCNSCFFVPVRYMTKTVKLHVHYSTSLYLSCVLGPLVRLHTSAFQDRNRGFRSPNCFVSHFFGVQPRPAKKTFAQSEWKKWWTLGYNNFPTSRQKCVKAGRGIKTTGNQIRIQRSCINSAGCAALQRFEPNSLLADKTVETEPCWAW